MNGLCQRLARALLTTCVSALSSAVFALDAGHAAGALHTGDTGVALTSALALHYDDRAHLAALVDGRPELRIVLSAHAIDAAALDGPGRQRLRAAMAEHPQPGVLLSVAPDAHGAVRAGELSLLPYSGQTAPVVHRLSGLQLARGEQRVLGVLDFTSADGRLRVLARFNAPLFHDLAALADRRGDEAQSSPQTAVLIEYEQALRQGAFDHARRLATPALRQQLAGLEQRDEGDIEALVARLSSPAARRREVQRLVTMPPYAYLVTARADAPLIALRQAAGRWRVDLP